MTTTSASHSDNVWLEIDADRLAANVAAFVGHLRSGVDVAAVVKSNGYGHGLEIAARAFVAGGARWLCVHAFDEAEAVRALDLGVPILVLGPLHPREVLPAVAAGFHVTVYDLPRLEEIEVAAASVDRSAQVHLKLETGTNRQGLRPEDLPAVAQRLRSAPHVELAGVHSHFANIEDTTRHEFARAQIAAFEAAVEALRDAGFSGVKTHMASSAAAFRFPATHYELVRVGIAAYGHWPSRETLASAREKGLDRLDIAPALTWKTRVAQVKPVPAGEFVGYGCTYKVEVDSRIAVLPVGYADGFRRAFDGNAWVLVRGRRCPVRGRVCMNLTMIDVSHLPQVEVGEEVVLLGRQNGEELAAETLASWAGTIHYEILAGLGAHIPRYAV